MPLNALAAIYASGNDLIPHIEEAAFRYIQRNYALPSRVAMLMDMTGWNARKVSEYAMYNRAVDLAEDTDIPDTTLPRARFRSVEPKEIGHRYRISDRRINTDLEDIIADTVQALGQGIGDRIESDLHQAHLTSFTGGTLGSSSVDYTIDLPIDAQHEFVKLARGGRLYHVIHPFQARHVLKQLVTFAGANAAQPLQFVNNAISAWQIPGFDNLEIVVSSTVPRRVIHKLSVQASGGTFRLQVGPGSEEGVNITAAITYSATPATLATNIKNALEALTFSGNGTWTVTGSANNDLTITPPASLYLDADSELRIAVDPENFTVPGQKSAYDLLTNPTGPVDRFGVPRGVTIFERSATAKAPLFFREALLLDIRQPVTSYFEVTKQGRTAEYSAYTTYAASGWRDYMGMHIETKANSAFAVGS